MERQQSMHQGGGANLLSQLGGLDDDPAFNPVLLPPRTRADVVQERPAGGQPEEVAAANPGLAAAVPATVGKSAANTTTSPTTTGDEPAKVSSNDGDRKDEGTASGGGGGDAGLTAVDGGDVSGMDVPELAVL